MPLTGDIHLPRPEYSSFEPLQPKGRSKLAQTLRQTHYNRLEAFWGSVHTVREVGYRYPNITLARNPKRDYRLEITAFSTLTAFANEQYQAARLLAWQTETISL